MSKATQENIKRLLAITGATHQQLADIAGVDRSAVSHWKSGKAEPRMGHLQRIADHYGITTANLVNPHGMKYVRKGTDGRLRDNNTARIGDLRDSVLSLEDIATPLDVYGMELSVRQASTAMTRLTDDEFDLLEMFRSLNQDGRKLALSTIAAFVNSGSYSN